MGKSTISTGRFSIANCWHNQRVSTEVWIQPGLSQLMALARFGAGGCHSCWRISSTNSSRVSARRRLVWENPWVSAKIMGNHRKITEVMGNDGKMLGNPGRFHWINGKIPRNSHGTFGGNGDLTGIQLEYHWEFEKPSGHLLQCYSLLWKPWPA